MSSGKGKWNTVSWHCPNCGAISTGVKNSDGTFKVECTRCHTVMVRRIISRRHNKFEIYAPDKEELIEGILWEDNISSMV